MHAPDVFRYCSGHYDTYLKTRVKSKDPCVRLSIVESQSWDERLIPERWLCLQCRSVSLDLFWISAAGGVLVMTGAFLYFCKQLGGREEIQVRPFVCDLAA